MNIQTVLEPLNKIEEAYYPDSFSMDHLKMLPSFKDRVIYASKHLTKEGSGSSRVVFSVDKDTVLKVSKNKAGLAQNEAEAFPGIQKYSIVAKVIDSDPQNIFIEMERAQPISPNDFYGIQGFAMKTLFAYMFNYEAKRKSPNPGYLEPIDVQQQEMLDNNEWVQELIKLATEFKYIIPGDFAKYDSYGVVKRNGKWKIVLIDYGFTENVYTDHYTKWQFRSPSPDEYVSRGN